MTDKPTLKLAEREMLDRIARATEQTGALLVLSIAAESRAACRTLERLMSLGLIERCQHPTIVSGAVPAMAVRLRRQEPSHEVELT